MLGGVGLESGLMGKLGRAWVLHGCQCMDGWVRGACWVYIAVCDMAGILVVWCICSRDKNIGLYL